MGRKVDELVIETRSLGWLLPKLMRRPPETLAEILTGRDVVFLTLPRKRIVALNNPRLVAEVFGDPDALGHLFAFADSTAGRLAGSSLPGLAGDAHRQRREVVAALFADPDGWAAGVTAAVERVVAQWRPGTLEVLDAMNTVAREAVASAVFGADYEGERPALIEYHVVSRKVVSRIFNPLSPLLWRTPVPFTRRFERAQAGFGAAVQRMIGRRREDSHADDALARLVRGRTPDGAPLTDAEVRDEAWAYYSQGAPQYALTWVWWLLGRHPDVERRVHEEVDGVSDARSAAELPLTNAVVREALRLYPPSWVIVHPAGVPSRLNGEMITPGMPMLISPWALQRDGRFWERPDAFEPERWLGGPGSSDAYAAFGAGPRRCPARGLGELMVTLAVAAIARRFVVRPRDDSVDLGYLPFLQPKGGMPAELLARRQT